MEDNDLHDLLEYKDGKLLWKKNKGKVKAGTEAGWLNSTINYRQVEVNGKTYYVHRVIFFLVHGYFPKTIDHINRNTLDNRIENLREATNYINICNSALFSTNTSGHKGVSYNKTSGKWEAYVIKNRTKKNLGLFVNKEDAILVATEARKEYHGQYA